MDYSLPRKAGLFSWETIFLGIDRLLGRYVKFPWQPLRKTCINLCLQWILRHQEADGAWSGIQPPWVYSLMALKTEGYALDHPAVASGLSAFDKHWSYERNGGIYLQASESPVWDTGLSMLAMLECGRDIKIAPSMQNATARLLQEQVQAGGDWQVYVKNICSGGWSFERANDFYPDVDDTAVMLTVLNKLRPQLDDTTEIDQSH